MQYDTASLNTHAAQATITTLEVEKLKCKGKAAACI